MRRGREWIPVLALLSVMIAAPAFGQGGTSSATLSGVVVDKDGGQVPGATVVVTKTATGEKLPPQITNASGAYSFPGLAPGKYTVNISLQGFKTQEIETTLNAGSNNSIGLPSGSSICTCFPPGPLSMSLRSGSPACFSFSMAPARSAT